MPKNADPRARPDRSILSFLGGAGDVTGSRFLVETPQSTVLVDCGLFQGFKAGRERNWAPFPIDPAHIDAVIVTHAHIDHVGYLPRLARSGFRGDVWCTTRTADLARIVLPDSGHLHEEEAEFANRVGFSKHHPALPLYTEADAIDTLSQLRTVEFGQRVGIGSDIEVVLHPAGHILGSAIVSLDLARSGRRVVFSGDLGRPAHPLLVAPSPPSGADVTVIESTYGGRRHDDVGAVDQLGDLITRTARRGGTVVIPAFAVDRTEVVLFHLRELMASGAAPSLPVYVDSPMALRALGVYRAAMAAGDGDVRPELHDGRDPFDGGNVHEIRSVEESKALAHQQFPSIIVSASGMATGGRVLHHLARLLPDHRNAVALVGFQAAGTRGRLLAEGATSVKLLGQYVRVAAEVANNLSFSVHADHEELVCWFESADTLPDTACVVHGEPAGANALRDSLAGHESLTAVVPRYLERVRLD